MNLIDAVSRCFRPCYVGIWHPLWVRYTRHGVPPLLRFGPWADNRQTDSVSLNEKGEMVCRTST